jgi:ribosomal-protein-alanine N-acetyltransferase
MAQAYPKATRYVVSFFVNASLDQNVPATLRRADGRANTHHAMRQIRAFARERVAVMAGGAAPGREVVLETGRLLLRPWRVAEAVVLRQLWTERDPRVPPHRRIDAEGHPTVADLEDSIRTSQPSSIGLLAVERTAARDVIGYCGLVDSGRVSEGEPELAFELLRRVWRQGYATEASLAVLEWARSSGYERLWATVWEWNTASRRVLAKVGFIETERTEVDAVYGTTLFTTRRL